MKAYFTEQSISLIFSVMHLIDFSAVIYNLEMKNMFIITHLIILREYIKIDKIM